MPTCSGPRMSKLEAGSSQEMKKDILLLDLPQNPNVRWNKKCQPQSQLKGIYTWTSSPRTLYQNRMMIRENNNQSRMPSVPFKADETADEKRETTGELTILTAESSSERFSSKPEAIVRPLRRREPSDDENRPPELQNLEAQIIDKLVKLEKPQKAQKDFEKKPLYRHSQSRESKKSWRDGISTSDDPVKRPLFITTVPRGVFLQPQPVIREIVAKARHVYAFASRPRILGQHNRRELQPKQNNQNSNNNLINKNIHSFDELVDSRISCDKVDDDDTCRIEGVKIPRTRESQACQNLMYDRRVVRGSNFASTSNIPVAGDVDPTRKEEEAKRRQLLRKRQVSRNQRGVIGTPPPVHGRKHETIQTEKYLEELFTRPIEIEQSCQTDLFLQRPPTPPYVCEKVGVDVSTEISEGELFDFDAEVQPILETLIGRTLQQALAEVIHEEEIADLQVQQQKLLAIREAEMAELQRLEEQENRLQSEKNRRGEEEEHAAEEEQQRQDRVTAAKLLQGHIADLLPSVLDSIDSVREAENKDDLQQKLTPWLAEEVASEIGQMIDSRELLLEIVKEVLHHRAELYARFEEDTSKEDDGNM
ncbi:CLUMA_CG009764, isoform B [Clunio marinus]|uniref:CLUMA_CG009764, isoform B n=1 Tax=Clunio marinus TaxID=568069 RepID=A0A1J1I9D4_9DIPT|nr:CLUMA_CG009764, isoform B [Clunio marinus]